MTLAKWRTLHDRIAYENQWVQVRVQAVELPDGERYSYTVVDRPAQGVATFLFDEDGRLLIEQEYRHAIGEVVWQLQILGGGNWGSYRAERISELYPT